MFQGLAIRTFGTFVLHSHYRAFTFNPSIQFQSSSFNVQLLMLLAHFLSALIIVPYLLLTLCSLNFITQFPNLAHFLFTSIIEPSPLLPLQSFSLHILASNPLCLHHIFSLLPSQRFLLYFIYQFSISSFMVYTLKSLAHFYVSPIIKPSPLVFQSLKFIFYSPFPYYLWHSFSFLKL